MKLDIKPQLPALLFGFVMAFLSLFVACNSKKNNQSEGTVFEEKPMTTAPVEAPKADSIDINPVESKIPPTAENKVYPSPQPKSCTPNFNAAGKAKDNHYFYYVTDFTPGEFKCWEALTSHGEGICQGEPCVIYYLDTPKFKVTSTPPHYIDPKVLQEHGIGRFEHTAHWWEVKGAKIWGRTGKQFVYYNTNNNAGG